MMGVVSVADEVGAVSVVVVVSVITPHHSDTWLSYHINKRCDQITEPCSVR